MSEVEISDSVHKERLGQGRGGATLCNPWPPHPAVCDPWTLATGDSPIPQQLWTSNTSRELWGRVTVGQPLGMGDPEMAHVNGRP